MRPTAYGICPTCKRHVDGVAKTANGWRYYCRHCDRIIQPTDKA